MTYLVLYLLSIVSPVLALAEPLCLLSAASSPDAWFSIAVVVAAGQTTGFTLLYFFGDRLLKWMPKVRSKLEAFDISDYKLGAHSIIVCGAIFGLPPATLLAAAGRIGLKMVVASASRLCTETFRRKIFYFPSKGM